MSEEKLSSQDRAMAAHIGATTPAPSTASSRHGSFSHTDDKTSSGMPVSAYYIMAVEACERFCFDGLRVSLIIYFMNFFHMDQETATVKFHTFFFIYHITPLLGATLADGFIGRYATILILTIVYVIGTFVLAITAIPQVGHFRLLGPALGLLAIASGAGGIKPCVSTFVADQVTSANMQSLGKMFRIFYVMMQVGSLAATIIVPSIRSHVQCFGYDCYSLAFGVPSFLMFAALVIFIIGTPLYRRVRPKENVIAKFFGVIWRSIRNGIWCSKCEKKEHWFDYADDKYSANDISDVRAVMRVFRLFLPLMVYQALQNQKGSRWTLQATSMNGSLGPFGTLQPDQMQALSYIFVLLFIPLFERVVYPAAAKFNWLIKPLQRIFLGLIFTGLAYVVGAMLQQAITSKANAIPVRYYTQIYNGYNCPIMINGTERLEPDSVGAYPCEQLQNSQLNITSTCEPQNVSFKLAEDELCPSIMITSVGLQLTTFTNPISQSRGVEQYALLRMISLNGTNGTVATIVPNRYEFQIEGSLIPTEYQSVLEANYKIDTISTGQESENSFFVATTAVYTVLLVNDEGNRVRALLFQDVPPFTVHMLWQTFQYMFLTCGEVLVSVTGLVFAYAHAPKRYKVVISSLWWMMSAMGDLLVILVAQTRFATNQAGGFMFYAVLMFFTAFIFGVLSIRFMSQPVTEYVDAGHEGQELLAEGSTTR